MDIDAFRRAFQRVFPGRSIFQPEDELWNPMVMSQHDWRLLYHLPSRMNGDLRLWWNGVGVLSFRRIHADEGAFI